MHIHISRALYIFAVVCTLTCVYATSPNPCVNENPCVSGECYVNGTGNSGLDAYCQPGGCFSDTDCNGRGSCIEGICNCIGLWSGNWCEVKNRCRANYQCFNGGRCVASDVLDTETSFSPTYTYICEDCNAGFYPPTCAIMDPSQVPFAQIIDIMGVTLPVAFDRELDYCNQPEANGFQCSGSVITKFIARGILTAPLPEYIYKFVSYISDNFTSQQPFPLGFGNSHAVDTIDLSGSGFGADYDLFSDMTYLNLPYLQTFRCVDSCKLSGDITIGGFQNIATLELSGPMSSFFIQPFFIPNTILDVFSLYLQLNSTIRFSLAEYPNASSVLMACSEEDETVRDHGDDLLNPPGQCAIQAPLFASDFFSGGSGYPRLTAFRTNGVIFDSWIPDSIPDSAPILYQFQVRGGQLSGVIPDATFNPLFVVEDTVLSYDFSNNALTGFVDNVFPYPDNLVNVRFENNQLEGEFPAFINLSNFPNLQNWTFYNNNWDCPVSVTDSSLFDYGAVCDSVCPDSTCITSQGECSMVSGGCSCFDGFGSVSWCRDTNCAQDSQSRAYFELFSGWNDPVGYMTGVGLDCGIPVCSQIPHNTTFYMGLGPGVETYPVVHCDGDGNIDAILIVTDDLDAQIPDLSPFGNIKYFQFVYTSPDDPSADQTVDNLFTSSTLLGVHVSARRLVGNLPTDVGMSTNLGYLKVHAINGSVYGIPTELGTLTSLTYLSLNGFVANGGSIPFAFDGLTSLSFFDMTLNGHANASDTRDTYTDTPSILRFRGTIPSVLWSLPSIQSIYLYGNAFDGPLPTVFSPLVHVDLHDNQFIGPIPTQLVGLESLEKLRLSSNLWFCNGIANYSSVADNDYGTIVGDCEANCNPDLCLNGGFCLENSTCACVGPFHGEFCQTEYTPNPCIGHDVACADGTQCRVSGHGDTDFECVANCSDDSDCLNSGFCDTGICHCIHPYQGAGCEYINLSPANYFCNASESSAVYLYTMNGAFVYGCDNCPEGRYGNRCVQLHPSEVVWETLIGLTADRPADGYNPDINICAQAEGLLFVCNATDSDTLQQIVTGVSMGSDWIFIDFERVGIVQSGSLDFTQSSGLVKFIMSNSGIGADFGILFNGFNAENIPALQVFLCDICYFTGNIDLSYMNQLVVVVIVSPFTGFFVRPSDFDYNLNMRILQVATSQNSTVDLLMSSFPNLVAVAYECVPRLNFFVFMSNCTFSTIYEGWPPLQSSDFFLGEVTSYPHLFSAQFSNIPSWGAVPSYLASIAPRLTNFACAYCGLEGTIPADFFQIGLGVAAVNVDVMGLVTYTLVIPQVVLVLEGNNLVGDNIYTDLQVQVGWLARIDVSDNHLQGTIPTYTSDWSALTYFTDNDWDCYATFGRDGQGETFLDSTPFDFYAACVGLCFNQTSDECYPGGGACLVSTGGCECYEGRVNSAMGETNCAQDTGTVVLCNWLALLARPDVFMAQNPGFNCSVNLCDQGPTVTHNSYVWIGPSNPFDVAIDPTPFYQCGEGVLFAINILTNDTGAVLPAGLDQFPYLARFQFVYNGGTIADVGPQCFPDGFFSSTSLEGVYIDYPNWSVCCSNMYFGSMTSLGYLSVNCHLGNRNDITLFNFADDDGFWSMNTLYYVSFYNCPMDATSLPSTLRSFGDMIVFGFGSTRLQGHLPRNILSFSDSLQILAFPGNFLTGPIPAAVSPSLVMVDLSNNTLWGQIPLVFNNASYLTNLEILTFVSPAGGNDFNCNGTDYSWVDSSDWDAFETNCTDCSITNPCLHDGVCLDADTRGPSSCECNGTGYRGPYCQYVSGSCDGNECAMGSTCVTGSDTYTCTCGKEQTGTFCGGTVVDASEFGDPTTYGDPSIRKATAFVYFFVDIPYYMTSSDPKLVVTNYISEEGNFQEGTLVISGSDYDFLCLILQDQSTVEVDMVFYLATDDASLNLTPGLTNRTVVILFDNSVCTANDLFTFPAFSSAITSGHQLTFGVVDVVNLTATDVHSLECDSFVLYTPGLGSIIYSAIPSDNSIVPDTERLRGAMSTPEYLPVTFGYLVSCRVGYHAAPVRRRVDLTYFMIINGNVTYTSNGTAPTPTPTEVASTPVNINWLGAPIGGGIVVLALIISGLRYLGPYVMSLRDSGTKRGRRGSQSEWIQMK